MSTDYNGILEKVIRKDLAYRVLPNDSVSLFFFAMWIRSHEEILVQPNDGIPDPHSGHRDWQPVSLRRARSSFSHA